MSAWARNIDDKALPVYAVATPNETNQIDGLESSERGTTVMTVIKIKGGDEIEDTLDELSSVVEKMVVPVLAIGGRPCLLTDTETAVDGGGDRRIGTLTMKFAVTTWLAEPLVSE